jgi:copper(I)-binding protein
MLMDLKRPLKQGDKVPVMLEFEKAGKVTVSFDVQGVGAQAPASGHMGHQDKKM